MSAKEPLAQLFAAHNIRTPINQDETNMLRTSEIIIISKNKKIK